MMQIAHRCAARHLRPSCPARHCRLRSIPVRAKTDQPQPRKDDSPKDNREVSARPVAGNKGPSSKPAAQSPTPDDSKKQHNQPLCSENANTNRREAGGKSTANPTTSIRQNSDTRETPLDAGWGPVEQDRDAVGVILTTAFVLGAFVLTTILFKAIGGYRAANTSKQIRPETGITTIKGEEAESETKKDKTSDRKESEVTKVEKPSSQDRAQTTSESAGEGQQQKTDAVVPASDDHDKDEDDAEFSSDSDHVTDGSDQDQDEETMHESLLGQEHQQGISDSAQTSPSSDGQGVANSASEGVADEADYTSSDMSMGALKQKVSTAMRASASAADASKSASGWSTSAAEASSRAAESAERASAAASRAQHTLQGAAEAEAKDLASRIATAEAAVEQAEQAASEAVQFQEEASKAASVADRHSMDAADQADTANRSSRVNLRHAHGVQSILYSCQVWIQEQWRHLLDILASARRWLSDGSNNFGDSLQHLWVSVRDWFVHILHAIKQKVSGHA